MQGTTLCGKFVIFAEVRDKNQDNQRAESCSDKYSAGLGKTL
jgi:hypothetical protein